MSEKTLISLGSNATLAGTPPERLIQAAIEALDASMFLIRSKSQLYRSPAFPKGNGPDYVNAVVQVESRHSAPDVLRALHDIEADFQRERSSRWAPRTLDLDLLAVADQVLPDVAHFREWCDMPLDHQMRRTPDQLILPHPRIQDRAFVLLPLVDIDPDWTHPVFRRTAAQMLADLPKDEVAALTPL